MAHSGPSRLVLGGTKYAAADGTYATWTQADGVTYKSATNIGVRPTFGSASRQIETHIINYDGDLYNTKIRVAFARKLREEVKFNAVDDLVIVNN